MPTSPLLRLQMSRRTVGLLATLVAGCATAPATGRTRDIAVPPPPARTAPPPAAAAAPMADSGGFRFLQNGTAIITERYVRTATALTGQLIVPPQTTVTYAVTFDAAMNASRLEFGATQPAGMPGAMQPQRAVATRAGADSVAIEMSNGDSTRTMRVAAARDAVPFVNPSIALMETIARRARSMTTGDSTAVALYGPGIPPGAMATVRFMPDSAILMLGPVDVRLRIDASGRVLGAAVPSQSLVIERIAY